jgi:hypothetical protein
MKTRRFLVWYWAAILSLLAVYVALVWAAQVMR